MKTFIDQFHWMNKTIITINFNTEYFIRIFEHSTARLSDRITALLEIQVATGFRLIVAIEPMFFYRDFLEDYRQSVSQIRGRLDRNKIGTIILGSARFGNTLQRILIEIHPKTEFFQKNLPLHPIKSEDSKWRNADENRKTAYEAMIHEFQKHSELQFFLGAETPEMWEAVGLNARVHLDKFFYQYSN